MIFTPSFLPKRRITNFVSGVAKFMTRPGRPARPQRPTLRIHDTGNDDGEDWNEDCNASEHREKTI